MLREGAMKLRPALRQAVMLACLLVPAFGLLVPGCQSGAGSPRQSPPPASAAEDIQGDLTFWAWEQSMNAVLPELDGFAAKYPKVKVHPVVLTHDDAYKKFLLANAANSGAPDVALLSGYYVGQYIETGALEDLTDWVRPYRDRVVASKWPDAMKNGRYYAMPWDSGPVGLFYRRDLFARAGLPTEPEAVSQRLNTWERYTEAGQILKAKTGAAMHTLSMSTGVRLTSMFEMMLAQQGSLYFDSRGSLVLNRPEAVRAVRQMIRMKDAGITLDVETNSQAWAAAIARGQVATVLEAAWMGGRLEEMAPETSGLWGVAEMPAWEAGGGRAAEAGGSYLGISRQSQNKAAARAFIEYMVGNARTINSIYRRSGIFPSLLDAYDDPMYDEPQPFFAGQATRRLFVGLVRKEPPVYFSRDFRTAQEIVNLELFKALQGRETPEQAVRQMESRIRAELGRKYGTPAL